MSINRVIRRRIWDKLSAVARPDTRFHMNFAEVIPDFAGSDSATDRVMALPALTSCRFAFITPDNSLIELRRRMIEAGRSFLMSTYNILRGFLFIDPARVPKSAALHAAWLDGAEHYGSPMSLEEVAKLGTLDLMVTGASAVSTDGIRFGKGHGYFDLEWGMFTDLGIAHEQTPVVAVVHDVQVVEEKLHPSETDISVDLIATPTRLIEVSHRSKRPRGIRWDLLTADQIAATPPLKELARLRGVA